MTAPTDPGDWTGRVALVTGGSSGIGRAAALRMARAGAAVWASGRDEDRLAELLETAGRQGLSLQVLPADVSRPEECRRLVRETLDRAGRLDLVVNSAGVWLEGPAESVTEAQWNLVIDTNLKGVFFMCRHAIPALLETEGAIVNVSSDAGLMGNAGAVVYSASKGGVNLLTKALAVELAPRRVRVNAVCPGDVDTPMLEGQARDYGQGDPEGYLARLLAMYPQKERARFTRPEEVAQAIFSLADNQAVTGACLSVDFGLSAGY